MAGMKFEVKIEGMEGVVTQINNKRRKISGVQFEALDYIGNVILEDSNALVPVDTGALKASGKVEVEVNTRDVATLSITYGVDPELDRNYAMIVHERLDVKHRVGQAKFLETAYLQNLPEIPAMYESFISDALEESFASFFANR